MRGVAHSNCSPERADCGIKVARQRHKTRLFSAARRPCSRKRVLARLSVEIGAPPPRVCRRPRPSAQIKILRRNATGQPRSQDTRSAHSAGSPHPPSAASSPPAEPPKPNYGRDRLRHGPAPGAGAARSDCRGEPDPFLVQKEEGGGANGWNDSRVDGDRLGVRALCGKKVKKDLNLKERLAALLVAVRKEFGVRNSSVRSSRACWADGIKIPVGHRRAARRGAPRETEARG